MNIFVLDKEPDIAAEYLCDKHIGKMCIETAQLLSSAVILSGGTSRYKLTHKNHPCAIWTRETQSNYLWLYKHGIAMGIEFKKRYGKIHKSSLVIASLQKDYLLLPEGELTPFALAMPDEFKSEDVVESYRLYYLVEKERIAQWNHSDPPSWWWAIKGVTNEENV
jgi:hypothetical protein